MRTATVKDLRTKFPLLESWIRDGDVISITKRARPVAMLCGPVPVKRPDFAKRFGGKVPDPKIGCHLAALVAEDRG